MTKFISVLVVIIGSVFLILSAGIVDSPSVSNVPVVVEETSTAVEVVSGKVEDVEKGILEEVIEVAKEIVPSNPIRSIIKRPSSVLSEIGVFTWTNTQRAFNGRVPLSRSEILDSIAEAKINDMFARQYFTHISPTGEGVGDLADDIGYKYLLIGENLALGDFDDDETLLQAWMDSPGHRENILNDKYSELGVAVGKGSYEGRTTWLAVQSFGLPISVCDKADENLLADIDKRIAELDELKVTLDDLQSELQSTFPKRGASYSSMVNNYNSLVGQYNSLFEELNIWVGNYNSQIDAFNSCVGAI